MEITDWLMILYCIIGGGIAVSFNKNTGIGLFKSWLIVLFWPGLLSYLIVNKLIE